MAIENPEETKRRLAAENAKRGAQKGAEEMAQVKLEQARLSHLGFLVVWGSRGPSIKLACPYCGQEHLVPTREIRDDGSTDARCASSCGDQPDHRGAYGRYSFNVLGYRWHDGLGAPLDRAKYELELSKRESYFEREAREQRWQKRVFWAFFVVTCGFALFLKLFPGLANALR